MRKSLTAYVDKELLKEDGIIPLAIATDETIDRDGEIVDPEGVDFSRYEQNPVVLYAHDYRSDPIGKTIAIRKEGKKILFTPQFAIDISPRAKMYFEMIKAGILSAFSIGFIAREWTDRKNDDGSMNRVFTKTELLEISLVPVPSNPSALVLARDYLGKLIEPEQKQIGEAIFKDMEAESERAEREKRHEERLVKAESTAAEAGTKAAEALEKATEALTVAGEAKTTAEAAKAAADADNGEVGGGGKAATISEFLKSPEGKRAVLQSVDQALGIALRDLNRGRS